MNDISPESFSLKVKEQFPHAKLNYSQTFGMSLDLNNVYMDLIDGSFIFRSFPFHVRVENLKCSTLVTKNIEYLQIYNYQIDRLYMIFDTIPIWGRYSLTNGTIGRIYTNKSIEEVTILTAEESQILDDRYYMEDYGYSMTTHIRKPFSSIEIEEKIYMSSISL